jgi:sugar-specific transcriptional regulator TrmB
MAASPDDPSVIVAWLKSLGLTKYEALVYIALLRVTGATATEIHEISGVPRASVYPVLYQLQEKELVSVSQSAPKRFAALQPDEGIKNLLSRIQHDAAQAKEALAGIEQQRLRSEQEEQELIWNIYGITAIRKKIVEITAGAKHHVRIMAHPRLLTGDVRKALAQKARQAKIEIFTHDWDGEYLPDVELYVKKPPLIAEDLRRIKDMLAGGVCIVDDRMVMVVIGSGDGDAVALYSESAGFVRFFIRYYAMFAEWAKRPDRTGVQ